MDYGGYNSAVVNTLIDQATTAAGGEQAERLWREAARRLMDDAALVPLIEYKNAYAKSRRAKTTPAADLATEVPTAANGGVSADGRRNRGRRRSGHGLPAGLWRIRPRWQ